MVPDTALETVERLGAGQVEAWVAGRVGHRVRFGRAGLAFERDVDLAVSDVQKEGDEWCCDVGWR